MRKPSLTVKGSSRYILVLILLLAAISIRGAADAASPIEDGPIIEPVPDVIDDFNGTTISYFPGHKARIHLKDAGRVVDYTRGKITDCISNGCSYEWNLELHTTINTSKNPEYLRYNTMDGIGWSGMKNVKIEILQPITFAKPIMNSVCSNFAYPNASTGRNCTSINIGNETRTINVWVNNNLEVYTIGNYTFRLLFDKIQFNTMIDVIPQIMGYNLTREVIFNATWQAFTNYTFCNNQVDSLINQTLEIGVSSGSILYNFTNKGCADFRVLNSSMVQIPYWFPICNSTRTNLFFKNTGDISNNTCFDMYLAYNTSSTVVDGRCSGVGCMGEVFEYFDNYENGSMVTGWSGGSFFASNSGGLNSTYWLNTSNADDLSANTDWGLNGTLTNNLVWEMDYYDDSTLTVGTPARFIGVGDDSSVNQGNAVWKGFGVRYDFVNNLEAIGSPPTYPVVVIGTRTTGWHTIRMSKSNITLGVIPEANFTNWTVDSSLVWNNSVNRLNTPQSTYLYTYGPKGDWWKMDNMRVWKILPGDMPSLTQNSNFTQPLCDQGTQTDTCIVSAVKQINGTWNFVNLTVTSTGVLNFSNNSLFLNLTGTLIINKSGSLIGDSDGCNSGTCPNGGNLTVRALRIEVNGSLSVNAGNGTGGAGGAGGAIRLDSDEIKLVGSIIANGRFTNDNIAGNGGMVILNASRINLTGQINANGGGTSANYNEVGGNGGTVIINTTGLTFTGVVTSNGGGSRDAACQTNDGNRGNGGIINITVGGGFNIQGILQSVRGASGGCDDGDVGQIYIASTALTVTNFTNPAHWLIGNESCSALCIEDDNCVLDNKICTINGTINYKNLTIAHLGRIIVENASLWINATDLLNLSSGSIINNNTGTINLTAPNIIIGNFSLFDTIVVSNDTNITGALKIATQANGGGKGLPPTPPTTIFAGNQFRIAPGGSISAIGATTYSTETSQSDGGNLTIIAQNISILGSITATGGGTFSSGKNGGKIILSATTAININHTITSNGYQKSTQAGIGATGGIISLNATYVNLSSQIDSNGGGSGTAAMRGGNGGTIIINATNFINTGRIRLIGGNARTAACQGTTDGQRGNGGTLIIDTTNLLNYTGSVVLDRGTGGCTDGKGGNMTFKGGNVFWTASATAFGNNSGLTYPPTMTIIGKNLTYNGTINASGINQNGSILFEYQDNLTFLSNFTDPLFARIAKTNTYGTLEIRDVYYTGIDFNNQTLLNISTNKAFVDTVARMQYNTSGIITLLNHGKTRPKPQYDTSDTGSYTDCTLTSDPKCVVLLNSSSTLMFNVTHFTSYQAAETPVSMSVQNITFTPNVSIVNIVNSTLLNISFAVVHEDQNVSLTVYVSWIHNGTKVQTENLTVNNTASFFVPQWRGSLSLGYNQSNGLVRNETLTVEINVTDGNWSNVTNSSTFSINNSVPTKPVYALATGFTNNSNVSLRVNTSTDNDTDSLKYNWYLNYTFNQSTNTPNYTLSFDPGVDVYYLYNITIEDMYVNVSFGATDPLRYFHVDSLSPNVSFYVDPMNLSVNSISVSLNLSQKVNNEYLTKVWMYYGENQTSLLQNMTNESGIITSSSVTTLLNLTVSNLKTNTTYWFTAVGWDNSSPSNYGNTTLSMNVTTNEIRNIAPSYQNGSWTPNASQVNIMNSTNLINYSFALIDDQNTTLEVIAKWFKNGTIVDNEYYVFTSIGNKSIGYNYTAYGLIKGDTIQLEINVSDGLLSNVTNSTSFLINNTVPTTGQYTQLNGTYHDYNITIDWNPSIDNDTDSTSYYLWINGTLNQSVATSSAVLNFAGFHGKRDYYWNISVTDKTVNVTRGGYNTFTIDTAVTPILYNHSIFPNGSLVNVVNTTVFDCNYTLTDEAFSTVPTVLKWYRNGTIVQQENYTVANGTITKSRYNASNGLARNETIFCEVTSNNTLNVNGSNTTQSSINNTVSTISVRQTPNSTFYDLNVSLNASRSFDNDTLPDLKYHWSINGTFNQTTDGTNLTLLFPQYTVRWYYWNLTTDDGFVNVSQGGYSQFFVNLTDIPTVINVSPVNGSSFAQRTGINISVNVTDRDKVRAIVVNVTRPDGVINNLSLNNLTTVDLWSGDYLIGNVIGVYIVNYYAYDYPGNWNWSVWTTFNVTDVTPPNITVTDPSSIPNLLNITQSANLTALVYDETIIDTVFVQVRRPDGITANYTMSHPTNGLYNYSYNTAVGYPLGIYIATFIANDTTGNVNNTVNVTFNLTDFISPAVKNVSPINGSVYNQRATITISANVTDFVAVNAVRVNITRPDGTISNLSLTNITNIDIWEGSFTNTSMIGIYHVRYIANDTFDNVNSTIISSFNVTDYTNPNVTLSNVNPAILNVSDITNLTVTVMDETIIDKVKVQILMPNGSASNSTMSNIAGAIYNYSVNTTGYGTGIYIATFFANDTSSNRNYTTNVTFNITDFIPPKVLYANVTPHNISIGNSTNITFNLTDNGLVDDVYVQVMRVNGTAYNITASLLSGITYNATILTTWPEPSGMYNLTIMVNDTLGNRNDSITDFVEVYRILHPRIQTIGFSPRPFYKTTPLNVSTVVASSYSSLTVNFTWYVNNLIVQTTSKNVLNGTNVSDVLSNTTGNFTSGDNITVRFLVNDSASINITNSTTVSVNDSPTQILLNISNNLTSNQNVTFRWYALDNDTAPVLTFNLSVNGTKYNKTTSILNATLNYSLGRDDYLKWNVTANGTNGVYYSETYDLHLDSKKPTITIIGNRSGTSSSFTIEWSTDELVMYELLYNTSEWLQLNNSGTNLSINGNITQTGLADGQIYYYNLRVRDNVSDYPNWANYSVVLDVTTLTAGDDGGGGGNYVPAPNITISTPSLPTDVIFTDNFTFVDNRRNTYSGFVAPSSNLTLMLQLKSLNASKSTMIKCVDTDGVSCGLISIPSEIPVGTHNSTFPLYLNVPKGLNLSVLKFQIQAMNSPPQAIEASIRVTNGAIILNWMGKIFTTMDVPVIGSDEPLRVPIVMIGLVVVLLLVVVGAGAYYLVKKDEGEIKIKNS